LTGDAYDKSCLNLGHLKLSAVLLTLNLGFERILAEKLKIGMIFIKKTGFLKNYE
jgi:hypothetical protein